MVKHLKSNFFSPSKLTVLVISLVLIFQMLSDHKWENNRVIIHDVTGYYSYLPAIFIYNDIQMNYRLDLPKNEPSEGIWVNFKGDTTFLKVGTGMSLFYLPSFALAHVYAKNSSVYAGNGYSKPYQLALALNTLIIGILGLILCRLFLLKLFEDTSVAIALAMLYGGSNLYYYITMAPAMSHPYGFFLISWMLLLTYRFFEKPSNFTFVLLAFVIGWMVSVRPTNAFCALYPVLYGLHSNHRTTLKHFIVQHKAIIAIAVIIGFLPLLPQFLYWKSVMGTWVFYSYDSERFFFNRPHVVDGLFGFRKGFFLYTPTMLFAFIGLFLMRNKKAVLFPFYFILPIFIYVMFSWWCWWYGGHSARVLIEIYPFLLIGFAGFAEFLLQRKHYLVRSVISVIVISSIIQNIRFTNLYNRGVIHWDSMTFGNYKAVFWSDYLPENYWDFYKKPDYEEAMREGEPLY